MNKSVTSPSSSSCSTELEEHVEWLRKVAMKFCKEFAIHVGEFDELVGIASLGLVEAAERFDPEFGVDFRRFAYSRVRGALLDGIAKISGLSRAGYQKARALKALCDTEERARIHESSEVALASVFARAAQAALVHRLSFLGEGGEELISTSEDSPEDLAERKQTSEMLRSCIHSLPDVERRVLEGYYFQNQTFEEIGVELGRSKGWIFKIHAKAISHIREKFLAETHQEEIL
ncbi:MAG: sigma-70 family RNA polymerase sigma factor [Bdellovibrionales bacterium]|nr:sigma-70 family RNA polymerase sigma factor [Bdellovibrionales bacterium]